MSVQGNGAHRPDSTPRWDVPSLVNKWGTGPPAPPASWGSPLTGQESPGSGGLPLPAASGSSRDARPPGRHRRRLTALVTVAAIATAIGGAVIAGQAIWPSNNAPLTSTPSAGQSPTTLPTGSGSQGTGGGGTDPAAIAKKVSPALVDINTVMGYANEQGAGTGMVLTSGGEVLTNNHVIEGATSLSVTDVGNQKTYHATVVGYDRTNDVALLQLSGASGLRTVTVASSSSLRVGEDVVAVGNAGGSGGTPSYTNGEITATGQTITAADSATGTSERLSGLLETNAAVEPGDSGGALVNTRGQVTGMITAGSTGFQFENPTNVAFAIPITHAVTIGRQIANKQPSSTVHLGSTPFLGVSVASYPDGTGVLVTQVVAGGPAASAGLIAGDRITSFNDKTVSAPEDLSNLLLAQGVGNRVQLTYLDVNGQQHAVTVQLSIGPAQ
jgi:S1-C subfamily serine protease